MPSEFQTLLEDVDATEPAEVNNYDEADTIDTPPDNPIVTKRDSTSSPLEPDIKFKLGSQLAEQDHSEEDIDDDNFYDPHPRTEAELEEMRQANESWPFAMRFFVQYGMHLEKMSEEKFEEAGRELWTTQMKINE